MASNPLNNEFKQFRIAYDDYLDDRYLAKSMQGGTGGTTQLATSLQAGLMSAQDKAKLDSLNENIIIDETSGGCLFTDIGYLGLKTENAVISFEHFYDDYASEYTTLPGYENRWVDNQLYVQMTLPGTDITRTIVLNDKEATTTQKGYMSAADKRKLDAIGTVGAAGFITGNVDFTDNVKFTGTPTLTGGFFSDSATITATHDRINLSGSTIAGNPHFTGTPRFNDHVYFYTNDSVENSIVTAVSTATIHADNTSIAVNGASISGNPIFTGTPTFNNGANGISGGSGGTTQTATSLQAGLMSAEDKAKLDSLNEQIIIDEYNGGCVFTNIGYLGLTTKNAVISFEHLGDDYASEYTTLPGYENRWVDNQLYVQMTLPGTDTTRTIVLNDKEATTTQKGYMSAYDKAKLDRVNIANASDTVNGNTLSLNGTPRTGAGYNGGNGGAINLVGGNGGVSGGNGGTINLSGGNGSSGGNGGTINLSGGISYSNGGQRVGGGTIQFGTGGNGSITGNVVFSGGKILLEGLSIENGKLKIISGGQTYYFTPDA